MKLIHQVTLGALAALGLALSAGCSSSTSTGGSEEELTAEQCTYFAVGDKVQICHRTGSAKHPYNIIRTSTAGCASGHSGHAGDYITSTDPASPIYDPTCNGLGCIPLGAPVDGSVECCEFLAPSGGVCADIDECATDNGGCGDGYTCTNNVEAPPTCTEIDECAEGTDNCDANAACANTDGSFTCTCNAGYEGDGVTCTDIDECTTDADNCSADATCTNTPGSFTCECNAGFEGDGVTCTDVDECAAGTDNCDPNAACTNTPGSFTCTCAVGYAGDGVTCVDVNECALNNGGCSTNAVCTNLPGSRTCACQLGFPGDGFTCNSVCGDGIVAGAEQCDDGNTNNADGCSAACNFQAFCGDGSVNQPTEVCDRGALNGVVGSGCRADCTLEPQVQLSLRIHEHCFQGSFSILFTQDTPALNWPGNLNLPSFVTLGAHTGVIVYSGLNFTGQQRTFTSNTNFCSVSYPNGAGVNDNVQSIQMFFIP